MQNIEIDQKDMKIVKKKPNIPNEKIWKVIDGLDDYMISNDGEVKSLKTNMILKQNMRSGYKSIYIINKAYKVHRLVAKAFIPQPNEQKNCVNHKDGNKLNNCAENLKWLTVGENTKHAYDIGINKFTKRAVVQLDLDGNEIKKFESLKEAKQITGADDGRIANVCKGKAITAGGYKWKFANENPNEIHNLNINLDEFVVIKDYPNYKISENGKVYSIRFKKFLKTHKNPDGYETIAISNTNGRKFFLVHRLVAEQFIPKINNKPLVNHKDGNKLNNNKNNLEWVNNSENVIHANNMKRNQKL